MKFYLRILTISLLLFVVNHTFAFSLPDTWCINDPSKSSKYAVVQPHDDVFPIPPLSTTSKIKGTNLTKRKKDPCPGKFLEEIKLDKVVKYFETKKGIKKYVK